MTISRLEIIFLAFLLLLGGFLRLFRISSTAQFLGDQGRDAIIAADILKRGDIALIGPVTSVGNMYLGPLYYYFMVPWLAITYPSPVGPAIGVALVGTYTILLVYFLVRSLFGQPAAVFAGLLFTVSVIAINQVRFSWNPNLAPTVGLLIMWYAYRLAVLKKPSAILWLAFWFAVISELHYLALLLAGFIVWLVISAFISQTKHRGKIMVNSLLGLLIFGLSVIPLILFDLRHDHLILKGFAGFFTSPEDHLLPLAKLGQILIHTSGSFYKLVPEMLGSSLQLTHQLIALLTIGLSVYFYRAASKRERAGFRLFFLWFGISVVGISLYSSSVFIHYLSYTQAVSLAFFGVLLGFLYRRYRTFGRWTAIISAVIFSAFNLLHSPAFSPGQNHIAKASQTADSIYQRVAPGQPYNLVLISGTGDIDAQNYRYFLTITDRPPVPTDRRGEAESLFIVQEDYFDTKVTDSPIYEIVVFPNKEPAEVYRLDDGPTITVLKKAV